MKNRLSVQLLILVSVLSFTGQAWALDWTKSYTYDGYSHRIDARNGGSDTFYEWGTNGEYSGASSVCSPTFTALAFTSGKISETLTWTGSGSPPNYVWIKESAEAHWWAYALWGVPWSFVNGWSNTSITDTYVQEPQTGYSLLWCSKGTRKVYVDASSGVISRTAGFLAGCQARSSNNQAGYARVYLYYNLEITTAPSGSEVPGNLTSPPYKHTSPTCPITPGFNPSVGGSQNGGDPVDLATGAHLYLPSADIVVYNPYGPNVAYQRNHLSNRAYSDYASPGMTTGWVDNYDVRLTAESPGSWGALRLTYPNGAFELLTPVLSDNQPTGEFTEPTGSPYYVTGIPSATTGQWTSVEILFKNQTKWVFDSPADDTYMLSRIVNRVDRYISIQRVSGTDHRVTSVIDDSNPANALMTFVYNGNGYLSSITDAYGRKVSYNYGSIAGSTALLSISQIAESGTANPPVEFGYGYQLIDGHSQLSSVSSPSPTGNGNSTQTISYIYDDVRARYVVSSLVDANSNQHVFLYESNKATRIQVKNSQGNVASGWIEGFDIDNGNRSTVSVIEEVDENGKITPYTMERQYEDSTNPTLPTRIIDRKGNITKITYDQYGNITTTTTPRNTTTTYTYDYSNFSLGRLASVQEGTKPATTFEYYEPSGLVHTITGPKPGTTGGSETVTTTFTYDNLGNVLTKVSPGNNATTMITTTYNYTTDGSYTQPVKIGQPLTITDQLGHINHIRYDLRGNVTESTDALGNTSNYTYNIADQLSDIVYPSVN